MSKKVKIGNVYIGGGEKIAIQSMSTLKISNVDKAVRQALELQDAGCDILRFSVLDESDANAFSTLKKSVSMPLVADIHFDYRLAIKSIEGGADKVRINPGNIGCDENVKKVADACKKAGVPIRIGVNSGSLEKEILARYGGATPEAMVESGLYHIALLNKYDFDDIVLSLKSSDTKRTFDAYRLAAEKCKYPLHVGVTEAGTTKMGVIKSSAAIGGLLLSAIGNTLRISLTDDPVNEVLAAKDLLKAIGLRKNGINFVSCPTCGRTKIDLIGLANSAEERLAGIDKDITVAIMGCVVNGPGEAAAADIGIAGGDGCAVLFKKDGTKFKVSEDEILDRLIDEINKM